MKGGMRAYWRGRGTNRNGMAKLGMAGGRAGEGRRGEGEGGGEGTWGSKMAGLVAPPPSSP